MEKRKERETKERSVEQGNESGGYFVEDKECVVMNDQQSLQQLERDPDRCAISPQASMCSWKT